MNVLVREWTTKAEADLVSAERELRARKQPNYDAACFHAQQAGEKFLKAVLQAREIAFPKTHDLADLASMTDVYPDDREAVKELEALTRYAVIRWIPGGVGHPRAREVGSGHRPESAGDLPCCLRRELMSPR